MSSKSSSDDSVGLNRKSSGVSPSGEAAAACKSDRSGPNGSSVLRSRSSAYSAALMHPSQADRDGKPR